MRQNVGRIERIVRGVLGIWLVVVAGGAFRVKRHTTAVIAGVAGLGLLQNAVVGFCGCNWLFGLDTSRDQSDTGCDCCE